MSQKREEIGSSAGTIRANSDQERTKENDSWTH